MWQIHARSVQKHIVLAPAIAHRNKKPGSLGRHFFEERRTYNRQIFMQHIARGVGNFVEQTMDDRGVSATRHAAIDALELGAIV